MEIPKLPRPPTAIPATPSEAGSVIGFKLKRRKSQDWRTLSNSGELEIGWSALASPSAPDDENGVRCRKPSWAGSDVPSEGARRRSRPRASSSGEVPSRVVDRLWAGAQAEVMSFLHHPFFGAVLTHNVPNKLLTQYLNDEAFLFSAATTLGDYHKEAFSALLKAPNFDNSLRVAAYDLHSGGAEAMCFFLQQKAVSDNRSEALVAWLAMLRIRSFLETEIGERIPTSGIGKSPFITWIRSYGSKAFKRCIASVENALESLHPQIPSSVEMDRLLDIFRTAVRLDMEIFSCMYSNVPNYTQYKMEHDSPWNPCNLLFATDYDCTCTVKDTCELLVWAAETTLRITDGRLMQTCQRIGAEHDVNVQDCLADLPDFTFDPCLKFTSEVEFELLPGMDTALGPIAAAILEKDLYCENIPALEPVVGHPAIREALLQLADLETDTIEKVTAAGLLAGLSRNTIKSAGKKAVLQNHCPQVLTRLTKSGTCVHVISANWSRDLVLSRLSFLPEAMLYVHSNDLEYDESGTSVGTFPTVVTNAFDKEHILEILRRIANQYVGVEKPASEFISDDKGKMVVYIGDAQNDMLSLLDADLGIIIGDNAVLRHLLLIYRIQVWPLVEASAHLSVSRLYGSHRSYRQSGILFEASGWEDVEACLFGQCLLHNSDEFWTYWRPPGNQGGGAVTVQDESSQPQLPTVVHKQSAASHPRSEELHYKRGQGQEGQARSASPGSGRSNSLRQDQSTQTILKAVPSAQRIPKIGNGNQGQTLPVKTVSPAQRVPIAGQRDNVERVGRVGNGSNDPVPCAAQVPFAPPVKTVSVTQRTPVQAQSMKGENTEEQRLLAVPPHQLVVREPVIKQKDLRQQADQRMILPPAQLEPFARNDESGDRGRLDHKPVARQNNLADAQQDDRGDIKQWDTESSAEGSGWMAQRRHIHGEASSEERITGRTSCKPVTKNLSEQQERWGCTRFVPEEQQDLREATGLGRGDQDFSACQEFSVSDELGKSQKQGDDPLLVQKSSFTLGPQGAPVAKKLSFNQAKPLTPMPNNMWMVLGTPTLPMVNQHDSSHRLAGPDDMVLAPAQFSQGTPEVYNQRINKPPHSSSQQMVASSPTHYYEPPQGSPNSSQAVFGQQERLITPSDTAFGPGRMKFTTMDSGPPTPTFNRLLQGRAMSPNRKPPFQGMATEQHQDSPVTQEHTGMSEDGFVPPSHHGRYVSPPKTSRFHTGMAGPVLHRSVTPSRQGPPGTGESVFESPGHVTGPQMPQSLHGSGGMAVRENSSVPPSHRETFSPPQKPASHPGATMLQKPSSSWSQGPPPARDEGRFGSPLRARAVSPQRLPPSSQLLAGMDMPRDNSFSPLSQGGLPLNLALPRGPSLNSLQNPSTWSNQGPPATDDGRFPSPLNAGPSVPPQNSVEILEISGINNSFSEGPPQDEATSPPERPASPRGVPRNTRSCGSSNHGLPRICACGFGSPQGGPISPPKLPPFPVDNPGVDIKRKCSFTHGPTPHGEGGLEPFLSTRGSSPLKIPKLPLGLAGTDMHKQGSSFFQGTAGSGAGGSRSQQLHGTPSMMQPFPPIPGGVPVMRNDRTLTKGPNNSFMSDSTPKMTPFLQASSSMKMTKSDYGSPPQGRPVSPLKLPQFHQLSGMDMNRHGAFPLGLAVPPALDGQRIGSPLRQASGFKPHTHPQMPLQTFSEQGKEHRGMLPAFQTTFSQGHQRVVIPSSALEGPGPTGMSPNMMPANSPNAFGSPYSAASGDVPFTGFHKFNLTE